MTPTDPNLPIELIPLQDGDAEFIATLITNEASLEPVLEAITPIHPDLDTAWSELNRYLRIHQQAESVAIKLRLPIGKILLWARDNPEFYERHGYKTYDSFIRKYVCGVMGLKRSSLYEARLVAERLPDMAPETYEELGPTKVKLLANVTTSKDSTYQPYLDTARKMTAVQFEKWTVERGLIEDGAMETAAIIIRSNKAVEKMWEDFKNLPEVHSRVGSDSAHKILEAMIMECSSWISPDGYRVHCPHCEKDFSI